MDWIKKLFRRKKVEIIKPEDDFKARVEFFYPSNPIDKFKESTDITDFINRLKE